MTLEEIEKKRKQIIDSAKNIKAENKFKAVDEASIEAIENARISAIVDQLNRADLAI